MFKVVEKICNMHENEKSNSSFKAALKNVFNVY